ncbi:MAG: OmpA family protein, partial [Myxococcales bacterium]|nr:OmpA family protein [Myxococcales bacterium]
ADASGDMAAQPEPAAQPQSQPAGEAETPWIKRYRPVRNSWELGVYGGIFVPSSRHEFYRPNLAIEGYGHQPLASVGPDIGLRVGYYPLSFLGIELEGGVIPTSAADGNSATLFTFRPVALAQLPYRIAPFVRVGFGMIGISSSTLGNDIDPSLNFGGGLKFYINRLLVLRLDVIDNVATAYGVGNDRSHNLEVLLGLSLRLGKKKEERKLIDSDGDTLYDPGQAGVPPEEEDACPMDPGPRENRGCPLIDSDGDGLYDPGQYGVAPTDEDRCPVEPGPRENQGCPLLDSDGDTLYDPGQPVDASEIDACPNEPGPRELQGCPDRDGDGIIDIKDQCPDEAETFNQYKDADGCPDEVPTKLKKFTGIIKGIYFDVDKDTIKPRSKPILDRAVTVLTEFSDTRIRIEGHTDTDGSHEHNMDLSKRRAESVKRYFVEHGIDASRIETEGYGPDVPIADNKSAKGKAKNRRIEFKLVQ